MEKTQAWHPIHLMLSPLLLRYVFSSKNLSGCFIFFLFKGFTWEGNHIPRNYLLLLVYKTSNKNIFQCCEQILIICFSFMPCCLISTMAFEIQLVLDIYKNICFCQRSKCGRVYKDRVARNISWSLFRLQINANFNKCSL